MRRHIIKSMLALALFHGIAGADEPVEVKPKPISSLEQVAALDPATTAAHVYCYAGVIPALVKRCPQLAVVTIECHSDVALEDLQQLRKLKELRELVLGGDMSFPTSHFKVVGELQTLRSLRIGLP